MIYLIGNQESQDYMNVKAMIGRLGLIPHEIALIDAVYPKVEVQVVANGRLYVDMKQITKAIEDGDINEGHQNDEDK